MKKVSKSEAKAKRDDGLRSEYRFDYSKAKPNRFAQQTRPGSVAVLLDPDVAQAFKSPESVNAVLRALMVTMPAALPAARRTRPGAYSAAFKSSENFCTAATRSSVAGGSKPFPARKACPSRQTRYAKPCPVRIPALPILP
jgi:hypothetical protein